MKILFVTDLHGNHSKYKKIVALAKEHRADIVINGGDMLPKGEDLFDQDKFITGSLCDHFSAFEKLGIHYLCCLGNDDLKIFDELFENTCHQFTHIHCIAQRKITIANHEFVGMNWVKDYPFRLKDRCRLDARHASIEEQFGTALLSRQGHWKEIPDWYSYVKTLPTIEDELDTLERPQSMDKAIYVIHAPPTSLGLDKCAHGAEVGSQATYRFIEKNQPLLTLHGHIHESPQVTGKWFAKLNRTVCIQPGQMRELSYVVIDLEKMQYEKFLEAHL